MATAKKQKDGTWRIQPCVTVDGKKLRTNIRSNSKREAEQLALEWVETQQKYKIVSDPTLREAVNSYIEIKSHVLSPSSITSYHKHLRNAFPELMNKRIRNISQRDLQAAVNQYAMSYAPKTVNNAYSLVVSALKLYGISLSASLPKKKVGEVEIPADEEVETFYEAVKGTALELPFLIATQCGCRASEISGLHERNIFDDYIRISEAKVYSEFGLITKGPKSAAGNRDIPTAPELCKKLREAAQQHPSGYVTDLSPQAISKQWSRLEKGGRKLKFHSLRHYYASKALLLGIPPRYISELMGHSSQDMINRVYVHTFPKAKHEFASLMVRNTQQLLGKSEPKSEP